MWNFERKEIAGKAVVWCIEHDIEPNPVGVVIALDALELLNDPAAQQKMHPTGGTPCKVCGRVDDNHLLDVRHSAASG